MSSSASMSVPGRGPVLVLERLPGGLGLGVVGDPRLVVGDVREGQHGLRDGPVELDAGEVSRRWT